MFRRRRSTDAPRALYDLFCARLARCGLARGPAEGPREFAARAAAARPDLAGAIHEITRAYEDVRYARGGGDVQVLRRRLAAFRP
jgi:hypothetical protein